MADLAHHLRLACLWEATARKAGNVHPAASFRDLTFNDFARSADAMAPAIAGTVELSIGPTILAAVRATRSVVQSNTNLGMILLLAPLSKADPRDGKSSLEPLLRQTTVADSRDLFAAIRLASPGGLGKVDDHDVSTAPTLPLRDIMALAADRDMIARQYANGFADLFDGGVPKLLEGLDRFGCVEGAILHAQLQIMAAYPDSLIARKRGLDEAVEASRRAAAIDLSTPSGRADYRVFDNWLRAEGHSRNPGTTADLVAGCLFIALREHRMEEASPFPFLGLA
jgi:triphosphoribosyl-dephospho-CoA synthase